MTPNQMIDRLSKMEKAVIHERNNDIQTKYEVVSMFKYLKKLIQYQVAMTPKNISDDRHYFECPRCGQAFESEWTAEDFIFCPECGQRFREVENEKE